jgi:hypothetical protein
MSKVPYGFELTRHDYFTPETDYKTKKKKKEKEMHSFTGNSSKYHSTAQTTRK